MRGKTILWLALTVMLFGLAMPSVARAQDAYTIYVDPPIVHNEDMHLSEFSIDINVEYVEDLYGYAFILDYAPYSTILVASKVTEGDFLQEEGIETDFTFKIDPFHGEIKIGNCRLGQVPGVDGNGTLATITFVVMEAGASPLDLTKVELYNSNATLITGDVVGGYYSGPTAEVAWALARRSWGRTWHVRVGDTAIVQSLVTNYGEVDLQVKVRYDLIRTDGRVTTFWAGQTYRTTPPPPEYLYVNEYDEAYEWGWDHYGDSPWLDAVDYPDNYIESVGDFQVSSIYGFENITLGERVISNVILEGYCQYPLGYTEDVDIDIYAATPVWFKWLGSLWGTEEWGWHNVRWTGETVSEKIPDTLTEAGLNDLSVLVISYDPGETGAIMRVDSLRLKVEFASVDPLEPPTFTVAPGDTLEVDVASWIVGDEDVGRYSGTAVCYYSYYGKDFIIGEIEYPLRLFVK